MKTFSNISPNSFINSSYGCAFFPYVQIRDNINGAILDCPPSVVALGTFGSSQAASQLWFAPAGFNRGGLSTGAGGIPVVGVSERLTSKERDTLYESRINPIASFPGNQIVVFGQKTLQMAKSALDRVNVRRLLLEVKRLIVGVSRGILFEQNTPETRSRFVNQVAPLLALVQAQAGVESFRVVCDDTNNSEADREANKLNGRIVIVPTRSIEFIAIDFIITNSGVSFE